jgi:hypothetical protein
MQAKINQQLRTTRIGRIMRLCESKLLIEMRVHIGWMEKADRIILQDWKAGLDPRRKQTLRCEA